MKCLFSIPCYVSSNLVRYEINPTLWCIWTAAKSSVIENQSEMVKMVQALSPVNFEKCHNL